MKTHIFKFATIAAVLMLIGCNNSKEEKQDYQNKESIQNQIERGKNLVDVIGCNDCHSPKVMTERGPIPDPNRLLSGHDSNEVLPSFDPEAVKGYVLFNMNSTAVVGPWGTSFAGNLTPDDTGIGTWTEAQFLKAMKEGKYKGLEGSRQLLPPMPWPAYSNMPDEDIKAIFAYLKSIKPVENIVPQPVPPIQ
ncbi:c-type cytochrome [Mariniflexile gromovii]|uniref:C-type cytochrome n=1 Tax=Mariniflexile gromovii TaxID=362523 RepID=A0ABS4BNQ4_9FLAO|nr:c-type cytochrome [Mariniflexile gromovii]MBP0902229.1 c-type cytochrome [Mariniflexile gromovii]